MADNNTFNAKVVGVVNIENQEAIKALQGLLTMQKTFTEGFQSTATQAITAFNKIAGAVNPTEKQIEELNEALTRMRDELKQIQLISSSGKVLNVKNEDVQQALDLELALKKIAKAYDSILNQKKIEAGTFGLDQKTSTKALTDLKKLEEVAKSVKFQLSVAPEDAGLKKYHADIEANTAALTKHIDKLREQMTLEKAHDVALRANAAFDKRIQARADTLNSTGYNNAQLQKNLDIKRNQETNDKGYADAQLQKNLQLKRVEQLNEQGYMASLLKRNLDRKKVQDLNDKGYADSQLKQNLQLKRVQNMNEQGYMQTLLQQNLAKKKLQALNDQGYDEAQRKKNLSIKRIQELNEQGYEQEQRSANLALKRLQEINNKGYEESERQKNLALKRKEEADRKLAISGRAQYNQGANQLDESNLGRSAAGYRLARLQQTTVQQANPVYQAQDYARRQRAEQERLLADVYRNANAKPEVSGLYRLPSNQTSDASRVQAAETILNLQRQLVDLQRRGTLSEEESLRIRGQISSAIGNEIVQRNKAGNLEAQQRQAERNMARVRGTGGASLLAVQATLMANYAMLNGFTGAVRTAIGSSIELEAELKNVQAVTGTTNTEMVTLKDRIEEVASASKFTSSEVAGAALTLGQAGLTAKQVGQTLGAVTTLAAASGTSLSQSVDLVTAVIGVFDKTALDMGDVANKISQAANSSKVSVEKLAAGFQYAGNIAAQSGISFEETTAAMSAMANAGIRSGSTMGTGLRQFLVETQKPSAEFLATISRIGLTMQDLDFKSHGLVGVARRLRDAGFIASDAIRSFDVRGAAAFNALIANPDDLERQYTSLLNTKAALRANEIQMDSLKSQATRLGTSLENLASVGFQPMSALLQVTAEKTANVVIWMSEHEKTVKVLGSTLAAVATTAMALHISSLVKGAVAMLSWTTAAGEATKATTLLSASQATWAGLKATWAGLETTVMTLGVAFSRVAREGLTMAERWAVGTAMVGNELKLLWAACLESPLLPLVAAIGVAAGAFYMLSDSSDKAKEEIDKAKASVNDAKSAYEDKAKAVESLTSKINELNYKQKDSKTSNEELQNTVMSLNSQFGGLGLSIDSNTKSYGEMIAKMREVRGEMEQMALAKLRVAQDENNKLQGKQQVQADQDFGVLRSNGTKAVDTALKHSDMLTKDQVGMLTNFKGQLQSGQANLSTAEGVRSIIDTMAQEMKSKGFFGGEIGGHGAIEQFDKTVKALDTYIRSASDLGITKAETSGLTLTRKNTEDSQKYRQKTFQVDGKQMSLENILDTFGGNMRAKAPASGDVLKDYDKFYEMSEKELASLAQVKESLIQDQHNPKLNQAVVSNALANVRGLMEGIKSDVRGFAAETDPKAKREYDNESRVNKAREGSKNKNIAASAIQDQAALDKKYKTRSIVDPDEKANAESSIEDAGNIKAQNKLDSASKTDRTAEIEAGIRERIDKAQQASLLRSAEADKAAASVTQDLELVQKYWTDGLKKIEDARGMALAAAKEQKKKEEAKFKGNIPKGMETVWAGDVAAINMNFDQQARQFTDSFKGFGKVVGLTLRKMEDAINRRKQDIEDQKVAGEDRVYASSARLRELEMVQALGKRAKDKTFQTTTSYDYGTTEKQYPQTDPAGLSKRIFGADQPTKGTGISSDSMGQKTTFGPNGVNSTNTTRDSSDGAASGGSVSSRGNSEGMGARDPASLSSLNLPGNFGTIKQQIARENVRVAMVELEENQKYLDSLQPLIDDLTQRYELSKSMLAKTSERIRELEAKAKDKTIKPEETEELNGLRSGLSAREGAVKQAQGDLNTEVRNRRTARKDNTDIQLKIAKNTEELPTELTLDSVKSKIKDVADTWAETVQEMDANKVLGDGVASILGGITGQLGNSFAAVLTGTKSIKSAVKDMAASVIKSMLDIASQMAAMQAMKGIMGALGFTAPMGSWGTSSTPMIGGPDVGDIGSMAVHAATGGWITPAGKLQRFATGGPVTGGVSGRDSVPAMVMPGEYILKKSAVDAVGVDYLHGLNQATSNVVSSSTPKAAAAQQQGNGVVNVWVVTPDQQPAGMGPKDVVAAVSDDISRGGSIKKLIKSVSTGQI